MLNQRQFTLRRLFVVMFAACCLLVSLRHLKRTLDPLHLPDAVEEAVGVLKAFLRKERRWPVSWDELEPYRPSRSRHDMDLETIRYYVEIDFTTNLEEISHQNTETFTGFHSSFGDVSFSFAIEELIELSKKIRAQEQKTGSTNVSKPLLMEEPADARPE
ncbi:MAG: hypothetical protein N2C14_15010 [Planctomycetales bacterium]